MGEKRKIRLDWAGEKVKLSEFTATIEPHSIGVLPGGNSFLRAENCNQLPLTEEIWQSILSYSDGATLLRFVQTSRECLVAGSTPEIWRDLVMRETHAGRITIDNVGKSWKGTYIKSVLQVKDYVEPPAPMQVQGIFSDYFYRSHICRSFAIPEQWMSVEGGSVDRVEGLSIEDFLTKYENINKPVVLKGACKSWKAVKQWKSIDYLAEQTSGRSFRATSGAAPLPAQFTMKAYFDYCNSEVLEETPLYLFDRAALIKGSTLHDDYYPDLQASCPYFDPDRTRENTHDLFQFLGDGRRPDHTWLIVGPQRSGSSFHIDPNATHAWNAAIKGRKRWIFYPPGVTPPGVHPSLDGDHVAMPISLGEWVLNFWSEHSERSEGLECTVEEGDVMFVPHGWWHSVINLDFINIAVTHNYVSKSNLPNVLRFLRTKQSQISGCRDRAESVKPEYLLNEFEKVMKEQHSEWLEEAKQQAEKGWTCKAWTDVAGAEAESKAASKTTASKQKRVASSEINSNSILSKAKASSDDDDGQGFSFSFL